MNYLNDERIVMTLDAGGTNFVFSALQGGNEVVKSFSLSAVTTDTTQCLQILVEGFQRVKEQLPMPPVAISFAFPGPADYAHGIIGDLPNFPSFRGGVPLGPYLSQRFGIPVFINNDGNLFAYGEALAGALPQVNRLLEVQGSQRRYHNLIGVTLGTGFGAGVVIGGQLLAGDNGCGGDVWCMRHALEPQLIAEESVSVRAIRRIYQEQSGEDATRLTPKDIFDIAEGLREGNQQAAQASFAELGRVAAAALVNAENIVDGVMVIGGGLAGAYRYILPAMMQEFARPVAMRNGTHFTSLQSQVFNLMDETDKQRFLTDTDTMVPVPGSEPVFYACSKKVPLLVSSLGASRAIALGAYIYALNHLT